MAEVKVKKVKINVEFKPTEELENIVSGESLNSALSKADRAITEIKKFSPLSSEEVKEVWNKGFGECFDQYGALYGAITNGGQSSGGGRQVIVSNVEGAGLNFTISNELDDGNTVTPGNEVAYWSEDNECWEVCLVKDQDYTDHQIQTLIDTAVNDSSERPRLIFKSGFGTIHGSRDAAFLVRSTKAGTRQVLGSGDGVVFTANSYGSHQDQYDILASQITIMWDGTKGNELVSIDKEGTAAAGGAHITLHLDPAGSYLISTIESILLSFGYDYSIAVDGDDRYFTVDSSKPIVLTTTQDGAGVGKEMFFRIRKGE